MPCIPNGVWVHHDCQIHIHGVSRISFLETEGFAACDDIGRKRTASLSNTMYNFGSFYRQSRPSPCPCPGVDTSDVIHLSCPCNFH